MSIKQHIQQSFDRAAHSYDAAAGLQRHTCDLLSHALNVALEKTSLPETPVILDAGCGTGYGANALAQRFAHATVVGLDIAPKMLARLPKPSLPVAGDMEQLAFADQVFDLYWSSLSLQWCALERAFCEAKRVLAAQGIMAVASLGKQTFAELRTVFSDVDQHDHTWSFSSANEIANAAQTAGFGAIHMQTQNVVMYYPTLPSLLREIKAVGANQVGGNRRKGLMTPKQLSRAETAYEALRTPQGLPLSYEIVLLLAHLKEPAQ